MKGSDVEAWIKKEWMGIKNTWIKKSKINGVHPVIRVGCDYLKRN